ncbi:hypothetical protein GMRT_16381 [Giardia muris]|uniref:Centrosomal protein of 70 kDa n=1 Tax=Giardia muris TaxID=5742 RepID=A0A4Z1SLM9_GIAMU|nr:hypothetical protein GMRT_16381 [Giardia muris]|eukprot:TNJ26562.1 hypothetical protein GMRT_16381 [Giardia muris]
MADISPVSYSVSETPQLRALSPGYREHLETTQYWTVAAIPGEFPPAAVSTPTPQTHDESVSARYLRPRPATGTWHAPPREERYAEIRIGDYLDGAPSVTPALQQSQSQSLTPALPADVYDPAILPQRGSFSLAKAAHPPRPQARSEMHDRWTELMKRARLAVRSRVPVQVTETAIQEMFLRLLRIAEHTAARRSLPRVADTGDRPRGQVLQSVDADDSCASLEPPSPSATQKIPESYVSEYQKALDQDEDEFVQTDLDRLVDTLEPVVAEGTEVIQVERSLLDAFKEGYRRGFLRGIRFSNPDPPPPPASRSSKNVAGPAGRNPNVFVVDDALFDEATRTMTRAALVSALREVAGLLPTTPRTVEELKSMVRAMAVSFADSAKIRKCLLDATESIKRWGCLCPTEAGDGGRASSLLQQSVALTPAFYDGYPHFLSVVGGLIEGALAEHRELIKLRTGVAEIAGYAHAQRLNGCSIYDVIKHHAAILEKLQLCVVGPGQDAFSSLYRYANELRDGTRATRTGLDPTGHADLTAAANTLLYSTGLERLDLVHKCVNNAAARTPKVLLRLTKEEAYSAFAVFAFIINYFCKMFDVQSVDGLLPKISSVHVQLSSATNLIGSLRKVLGLGEAASHNRIIEAVQTIALGVAEEAGVFGPDEAAQIMMELNVRDAQDVLPTIRLLKEVGRAS